MPSIIEIENVSKKFTQANRNVQALQEISLVVDKGDVYGIIGQSGAGKSTLIRCLARLEIPTEGVISISGLDIADLGRAELRAFRKKVGMIFQHFNLLGARTVAGNIAYPLEISGISQEVQDQRVDELLGLVGLKHKKDAYPSQLSGGEKQRVGIARALACHPEVLLCDEATSALDPKTTREILALLRDINQKLGVTIVLITHEMEVIKQICNKVAVIDGGRIVEKGMVADVFSDPQHPTTKHFLENALHEILPDLLKELSPNRKLLRLRFKGKSSGEPVISELVRKFNVDANILLGWLDRLQTVTIGTLVMELTGPAEGIDQSLKYLSEKNVHVEVIENERG